MIQVETKTLYTEALKNITKTQVGPKIQRVNQEALDRKLI